MVPTCGDPGSAVLSSQFLRNVSGWDLQIYDAHLKTDVSCNSRPGACRDSMSHFSHADDFWDVSFSSSFSFVSLETSILIVPCSAPFRRRLYRHLLLCEIYVILDSTRYFNCQNAISIFQTGIIIKDICDLSLDCPTGMSAFYELHQFQVIS